MADDRDARERVDPAFALSAEDRYRLLAENASDIVYQTDGLNIVWISPSVEPLLGWAPDELVGQPAATIVSPRQDLTFIAANRERLLSGADVYQEMLLITRAGEDRWFAGRARPLLRNGVEVGGFIVGLHQIHEEVLARRALRQSELIYRSAVEHARVGMWLIGPDHRTIEVNAAMCDFLGRDLADLIPLGWREVTHPDDIADEEALLAEIARGDRTSFRRTKRYLRADGAIRHGDLTVAAARDEDGILLLTKQVVDITDEVEARERLTELATKDTLTTLPNRATILSELQDALATAESGQSVGALFIDLDNFKLVNESLGHGAGDSLLASLAARLTEHMPETVLGRFGGDEFLVVVPAPADEPELEKYGAQIRSALAEPFVVHDRSVVMTASIGAALSHPASTAATLLQDADVALSEAKRDGKSRQRVFNLGMASAAIRRLVVEGELRDAVDSGQFVSVYQPLHRLVDGTRDGFEALLRWDHPRDGLLLPSEFLPVAEDSGLIVTIGIEALRQVCRDIVAHPELHEKFAVNVSAVQLDHPDWLASTLAVFEEVGVDPSRLVVELTETAVMSSRRDLRDDLVRLRDLGVDIHVDDFGTGYSSISLLRDLPITGLKLDRSFVSSLTDARASGYALAEGLAGLSRAIGLMGIAEGVETQVQAAFLRAMGWSHAQGWLYGKAAPLEEWLSG